MEKDKLSLLGKVSRNIGLLRQRVVADGKIWALRPLFEMQNSLLEHRFPHEKASIIDWVLSAIGDIYRSMCEITPDFGYVMEKWTRTAYYVTIPPRSGLRAGDWEEIREQVTDPTYRPRRDQWLSNLSKIREATVAMAVEPKRKAVMLAVLDLQEAVVRWFESGDPYSPPEAAKGKLTWAVGEYFPRFWED